MESVESGDEHNRDPNQQEFNNSPTKKFRINGQIVETKYFGPSVVQGNLMKLCSDHSIFSENKFQLRYFILDLKEGIFKYGKHAFATQKKYKLSEVSGADIVEEPDKNAKEYQYTFVVRCVDRDLYLGCKSTLERQAWINGFNVFMEYRQMMNKNLEAVAPGLAQDLQQQKPEQIKAEKLRLRSKSKGSKAQEIVKALNLKGLASVLKKKNDLKEETKGENNNTPNQQINTNGNQEQQAINITNFLNGQNQGNQLSQQDQQNFADLNQLREKVLQEFEELERKRDEFKKEQEEFKQYQEGEILRLMKEKQEVHEMKKLYEEKLQTLGINHQQDQQEEPNYDQVKFNLDQVALKNMKAKASKMSPSPKKSPGKVTLRKHKNSNDSTSNSQNLKLNSSLTRKQNRNTEQEQNEQINPNQDIVGQQKQNNDQNNKFENNQSISNGNTTILDEGNDRQQRTFSRKKVKVKNNKSSTYNSAQGQSKDFSNAQGGAFNFQNHNKFKDVNPDDVVHKFDNFDQQENKDMNNSQNRTNSNSEKDEDEKFKRNTILTDNQQIENIDNDNNNLRELQRVPKKQVSRKEKSKTRKENIVIDGYEELEGNQELDQPELEKQDSNGSNQNLDRSPYKNALGNKLLIRPQGGRSVSIQYDPQQKQLTLNHNLNEAGKTTSDEYQNRPQSQAQHINNTSTIDTLIEKERDVQFLERLDKQNRMNLQMAKSKSYKTNNNSYYDNAEDFDDNKSSGSGQNNNRSYINLRSKFSNHRGPTEGEQSNNWDGIINIPDLTQQKSAKLQQIINNQGKGSNNASRQGANNLNKLNPSNKTENVEMKVDIPLESFDANWDDDIEASLRGEKKNATKQQRPERNYKTINATKEQFEEVWD